MNESDLTIDPNEPLVSFDGEKVHESAVSPYVKVHWIVAKVTCSQCGVSMFQKRYENQPVRWYADPYCDACCDKSDAQWETHNERRRGLERVRDLISKGQLSQWQADCIESDVAKEVQNAHTWQRVKDLVHKYEFTRANWFITGPPGTGKTHMACYMMLRCIFHEMSHMFVTGRQLEEHLQNYRPAKEVSSRLSSCRCLVIDDLETLSFEKDRVMPGFWQLLDDRSHGRDKTTIITTKMSGSGIRQWFEDKSPAHSQGMGANALERLRPYEVLVFTGGSLR